MKRYILNLLLLFSLGVTVNAQTPLFYDDFGSPEEAQVRRIWKYMPTGYNTFIFAHPDAPNIGNNTYSEAKAIENNFYAVIAPKRIYSSVGNPTDVWPIWTELIAKGDCTPRHNGDGGALVVNAGTTLSSLYVRFASLQTGKYYKLSYKIFVQNSPVTLKHQILNSSGNSIVAESTRNWWSSDHNWTEIVAWFHVPGDCPGGEYSVALANAQQTNHGNDFAIDELKFEEYESGPDGSTEIKCEVREPIAVDDRLDLPCDDRGNPAVFNVSTNDTFLSGPIDLNKFKMELMVPAGGGYDQGSGAVTISNEGKWTMNQNNAQVTFTPVDGFKGNPTPIYYRWVNTDGTAGNSGVAQLIVTYDCNPITNNDTEKMTVGTPVTIDILENDKLSDGVTPQASDVTVTLKNPFNAVDTGTTITVEGEGTWTYSESDGKLTFTPDAGFTGVPTPITYTFKEKTSGKTSTAATVTITVDETPPSKNYWHGTIDEDWTKTGNWTDNRVPVEGEDVEFATETNNGTSGDGNGKGAATNDLHLDSDRIIGDLINDSDKDLWVTTGNSLVINGEVKDNNATGGTIVVKADPENEETNGTLIFKDPDKNQNVTATVEFYNKAYECADCGFYRKSWQYFGIPVKNAPFPTEDVSGDETVNQWIEPFNGNKWQPAPYAPDTELQAFKGYEMTNSSTKLPSEVYKFTGILAVGDTTVSLTKTSNVNHSGVNLVGNSYTAAIPIATGLSFTPAITDRSVYLFNTGTRDQWKKLNGATTAGLASGQYLNVPIHLAGSGDLPAVIPSMHAFLIQADQATNLQISYDELVKNELVKDAAGKEIATRSTSQKLPYLMVDVIGEGSVDRVRVFRAKNTTAGFDSGWDGRKWMEEGIAQLYVVTPDQDALQVSTVPDFNSIVLGFIPAVDGEYQLDLSWSEELKGGALYLNDLLTGVQKRIAKGGTYVFHAKKGDSVNRFSLSYTENTHSFSEEENLIEVTSTADGQMKVKNESGSSCMLFISTENGTFLQRVEVASRESKTVEDLPAGVYVVRLQNAQVNDVRKVIVKNN